MSLYENCSICGRNCSINRSAGEKGFCGETVKVRLAWAGIHFGEEPPLTGDGGSGALFFTGCTLRCPFCQNWQISRGMAGVEIDETVFQEICASLVDRGAVNLNFVTGSHFTPTLVRWMKNLRAKGIKLPFLWNSSGFDSLENLEDLCSVIDIFLPDLKTLNPELSKRYFGTSDYPETVKKGISFIFKRKKMVFDKDGLMKEGIIVRHLVMPGMMENTREILKWFSENAGDRAYLSVMTQYTPVYVPGSTAVIPDRYLSESEYNEIISMIADFEIENGYIQELVTGNDWLPDFTRIDPFESELSTTVWSHISGFK